MDWSSKDGDVGEGTVQLALNLHLPPDMCRGHLPAGFSSLQRLLPLPYRTLLLFRLMMGSLKLKLLLDSRGGKFGPDTCLPIEVDGQTCNGALAIGYYVATPCACTKGGARMCTFKARDQTDPLFGHVVCHTCLKTSNGRLKTITAEVESFGLVINRITKRQSQISAIFDIFNKDSTLQVTNETMKSTMNQIGFAHDDVEDMEFVKLLCEWAPKSRRGHKSKSTKLARKSTKSTRGTLAAATAAYWRSQQNETEQVSVATEQVSVAERKASKNASIEKIAKTSSVGGRWSDEEHLQFEKGCAFYGWGNWKMVAEVVPTRDNGQCRSHAQKYKSLAQKYASPVQLPKDGWTSHVDNKSGKTFYYNAEQKKSVWEIPDFRLV